MIDDVLKGIPIHQTTKSLIKKVLEEISNGGNKAAPLRQNELSQLVELGRRIWTPNSVADPQTLSLAIQAPDEDRPNSLRVAQNTVPMDACQGTASQSHLLVESASSTTRNREEMLTSFLIDTPDIAPLSTTSSADFAHTFDFSQEQMLLLADHLDTDAMSTILDFSNHGLNEWF